METNNDKLQNLPYEDFAKLDIRVGEIRTAEAVPKSKKLLKMIVNFGPEIGDRQVVAGIAESYDPNCIIGLRVVAVLNIAPRQMMGLTSEAMLLAGDTTMGGAYPVTLVSPNGIKLGGDIR